MGRRYGIRVTLPFFIPAPPIPPLAIGTFGALIRIRSPMIDRRSLFDVGIAGPLAGLVVALPTIVIGLLLSRPLPVGPGSEPGIRLGSPLLFSALQWLTVGPDLPGQDVLLHPVAFAGWFGLFVTGLNLLPIGQLDGGHMAYALLGRGHRIVSLIALGVLGVMGITAWPGWFVWATLAFVLGRRHPPPLNDVDPLDRKRRIVGVLTFLLLLSLITPTPFTLPEI
jgi:membrane-associated protease RseP (regulator of RpoE activity)